MSAVPPAISRMVSESAAFRPTLSAYTPSTMPPTGRMKKPTPNVATASSSEVSSLPVGKNSLAMMTAKKLYDGEVEPLEPVAEHSGNDRTAPMRARAYPR